MSTFKKLWFFFILSLVIIGGIIFLFSNQWLYFFALFLGFLSVGTTYLYLAGTTRSLISYDFFVVSALGIVGWLIGIIYEMFLFVQGSPYNFLYPLTFIASLWLSIWFLFSLFFLSQKMRLPWLVALIWILSLVGFIFLLSKFSSLVLPLWKTISTKTTLWWVIASLEGIILLSLFFCIVFRHRMISSLYTALVLWLLFRALGNLFWIGIFQGGEKASLWFQYLFTLEWLGFLFGLDGVIYGGIHYPFHKVNRELQVTNEERMLSLRLDRVTRTLNADAFKDLLHYEVLRQKRQRSELALLAIEARIELPSLVSYTCSDNVLSLLASSLRANLRAHDVISHWGNGVFVILLMDTDMVGACTVGEKIRDVVAMSEYLCGQDSATIKLWMGVAIYMEGMTEENFLSLAFANLGKAKETNSSDVVSEYIFDYPASPQQESKGNN